MEWGVFPFRTVLPSLSNITVYINEHVYNILEKYLYISIIYLSKYVGMTYKIESR